MFPFLLISDFKVKLAEKTHNSNQKFILYPHETKIVLKSVMQLIDLRILRNQPEFYFLLNSSTILV